MKLVLHSIISYGWDDHASRKVSGTVTHIELLVTPLSYCKNCSDLSDKLYRSPTFRRGWLGINDLLKQNLRRRCHWAGAELRQNGYEEARRGERLNDKVNTTKKWSKIWNKFVYFAWQLEIFGEHNEKFLKSGCSELKVDFSSCSHTELTLKLFIIFLWVLDLKEKGLGSEKWGPSSANNTFWIWILKTQWTRTKAYSLHFFPFHHF